MIEFGFVAFLLSALMLVASACPHFGRLTQFTWFNVAQTQLQLYGFFTITMLGAIYYILPRAVGIGFAFPRLIRFQHWFAIAGIAIFVVALVVGGVQQGLKLQDSKFAFADSTQVMLPFLRASTLGLTGIAIANLLFALNVFVMIASWKWSVAKSVFAFVISPLTKTEVKA